MSERAISQEGIRPVIPMQDVWQFTGAIALDTSPATAPDAVTDSLSAPETNETEIIDRREFLFRIRNHAAAAGAVALVAQYGEMAHIISSCAEQIAQAEDQQWPENAPSLTFLDGAKYDGEEEVTIYLPGFGDMHSIEEAQVWKDTSQPPKDRLVGAVDYSNEGTTIDGIADVIRGSLDSRIKVINFVCRSIGGLYVLPLAAELGIPVGSILFISSPSKLSNGDFGNLGKMVAHLPENRAIGTFMKFVYNCMLSFRKNGFDPAVNMAEGWKGTMSGASEQALHRELKTASPIDIFDKSLLRKLQKVIRPNTKAAYTATDDPSSDETVKVVASGKDFQTVFRKLGVKLALLGMPYDGHANVEVTGHHMQAWVQSAPSPEVILAAAK